MQWPSRNTTRQDGRFYFKNVPEGAISISFRKVGYSEDFWQGETGADHVIVLQPGPQIRINLTTVILGEAKNLHV